MFAVAAKYHQKIGNRLCAEFFYIALSFTSKQLLAWLPFWACREWIHSKLSGCYRVRAQIAVFSAGTAIALSLGLVAANGHTG
jgi:hypothetical protein